jgi:integrase
MITKRCACPEPSRCRHPFWYCFMVKGVRYRRSTRTANRQTAGRIGDRRRLAVLDGRDVEEKPQVTLKAHIAAYVEHTERKNRTAYKDAAVLAGLLEHAGNRALLSGCSPFLIEQWKTHRANEVSRSTVNREFNIIRGCFSRAVEWGRIASSPCKAVKPYRVDDQRVRVLTDDELRLVLTQADPAVALLCRTTLECLPRLSEVLGIHRDHIGPTWIELRRKGGSVERVAVPPMLRNALWDRCHAVTGSVFADTHGKVPSQQLASLRVVRELLRLGIKDASHHTMRHTAITLMLEAGINPRAIQKLAGWSSLRMMERYGHARDTELRRAVTVTADYLTTLGATARSATAVS